MALAVYRVGAAGRLPPAGRAESQNGSLLLIDDQGLFHHSWQTHIFCLCSLASRAFVTDLPLVLAVAVLPYEDFSESLPPAKVLLLGAHKT